MKTISFIFNGKVWIQSNSKSFYDLFKKTRKLWFLKVWRICILIDLFYSFHATQRLVRRNFIPMHMTLILIDSKRNKTSMKQRWYQNLPTMHLFSLIFLCVEAMRCNMIFIILLMNTDTEITKCGKNHSRFEKLCFRGRTVFHQAFQFYMFTATLY